MQFKGLFIGIDRYASPGVNWLSCSRRDAVALYSLFTDTLGGDSVLLVDEDATRQSIEEQFQRLEACAEEDVVVITFSGHGSPTHDLVTYNADLADLANTCIPLTLLLEWFSKIPAHHLILILDCCFSGGVGAKVLQVDLQSRDVSATDKLLEQLSGDGRLILTASSATEPAWENQKIGHGLLTNYFIEALQGAEEVRDAGKISIYKLLEYVTKRVTDAAAQFGMQQHPTLRGTLDGHLTWPIFQAGTLYAQNFPDELNVTVTSELSSLANFNFPAQLIKAWAGQIKELNQLQISAINEFNLLRGEHLLVSAPTSSGKTLIGELAAVKGVINRKRAFFLFPLKALVNDKLRHFNQIYGEFGIRVIRATGDSTTDEILPLVRGQYDICLLTYEKFAALVLGNPHLLNQVGTIVVDEVQMITDETRGINLEFILTLLRMRRRQGEEPQLIALSAVIGDTNGFDRWLGARLLLRTERPVPLDEGVLLASGEFKYIDGVTSEEKIEPFIRPEYRKGSSQDWVIPLVRKLVSEDKSVIVFRATRGEARNVALYLASSLGLPPAQTVLDLLPSGDPSLASDRLREALAGGVAFHISDLEPDERILIEEQFRARPSSLKVIVSTTTLAMGVNTPAEVVVVVGLDHPGNKPYSIAEYKNIVGRAGRLGYSKKGTSFLISVTSNDAYRNWQHYVLGVPEDLKSQIIPDDSDPKSLITRILAAAQKTSNGKGMSSDEIVDFLEESFGAYQQKITLNSWNWNPSQILEALSVLHRHNLVEILEDGSYRLTELGYLAGEAGITIESIVRLVNIFSLLSPDQITDPVLIAASQITTELDEMRLPINKKSTQKEPQTWFSEIRGQGIPEIVINAMRRNVADDVQATLRAKKVVACLLWITNMPLAQIENILTQFGGKFDGAAGPVRNLRSRVCDILPTVGRVAEILHPGFDLGIRMTKLLVRLEIGVPAIAADLAAYAGPTLTRGDYLKLIATGLIGIDTIDKTSDEDLLRLFGNQAEKLIAIRSAAVKFKDNQSNNIPSGPILPSYES
jgi:replicative superfamily II helicase